MKCPKCGYLGFERVDRCRNCGYEFSLAPSVALPELPLRGDVPADQALDDLTLLDDAAPATLCEPASAGLELTLFGADDEPLISKPSPPRPPLAVRRATPEVPRRRAEPPRSQTLDLDLEEPPLPSGASRAGAAASSWPSDRSAAPEDAGLGARFAAVLIDLVLLATIDAVVIYFTLQICGISMAELGILPKGPLAAFMLVQNGGYLVVFTAGGQTLGKMAAGIKVVSEGSESPIDLGRAILRTLLWMLLAVPAGLGFLTALFSSDHRGLHDRFARTRVVRASV